MFRKTKLAPLAAVLAMLAGTQAGATTYMQMDLDDLVAGAAMVVEGTVESAAVADTGNGVFTTTVIRVSDSIVGSSGSMVTVVTPGGRFTSGRFQLAEINAGSPIFLRDQKVILFLGGRTALGHPIVGESQGLVPVAETASGPMVRSMEVRGDSMPAEKLKSRIREIKAQLGSSRGGQKRDRLER